MELNVIRLRSALSEGDERIDRESEALLSSLAEKGGFTYGKDGKAVFLLETGGTENSFKDIYKKYEPPYLLLVSMRNNSLPAALEIASFLNDEGLANRIIAGKAEKMAETLLAPERARASLPRVAIRPDGVLRGMRLGVIGRPSDWLIASSVNKDDAERVFGARLIDVPYDEFLGEIGRKKYESTPLVEKIRERFRGFRKLEQAFHIYGALKRIAKRYALDGFTLRCFDLLGIYENTACLAFSIINSEGGIAGCEGDVPALLTMALVRRALGLPSFMANPSLLDFRKDTLVVAHCTAPLEMCRRYTLMTHFESGLGVAVKGRLPLGDVTILKIDRSLDECLLFEGEIVRRPESLFYCRTQIEIAAKVDFSRLLATPFGNHLVVVEGRHASALGKLLAGA